jgi:hypothetical protein
MITTKATFTTDIHSIHRKFQGLLGTIGCSFERSAMKSLAQRTIASVAIVVTLALGTPALALAGTTTTPTTTTIVAKTPVIKNMRQYRAAEKLYLAKLKVVNVTFLAAVAIAKANLASAIGTASNSTQRISARATYRYAITEATIARSNALALLGGPPVKPGHTTTL